ncbi:MAG: MFS transporter [Bacillota bacterium]|nr:MFS transporter [Bacillota bacterium]
MRAKEQARSLLAKVDPVRAFAGLSPGWRGAVLGVLSLSLLLFGLQSYLLFRAGGILDVLTAAFEILLLVLLLAVAVTLLVRLLKALPCPFVLAAAIALLLLLLALFSFPLVTLILPLICLIASAIVGAWVYTWIFIRAKEGSDRFQLKRDVPFLLAVGVLLLTAVVLIGPGRSGLRMNELLKYERTRAAALDLPDPSAEGEFPVGYLSYGAADGYRQDFHQEHSLVTIPVDGRDFVSGWSKRRTRRFGFGPDALPLNGHVWYPEAGGRFPLVIIVHGNHAALEYSDPGYQYLARLLAARGYVVASVDENFLNISLYDDRIFLDSLRGDNAARGWLLLEHIALFEEWNRRESTALYQKIDMENIALIGHSRGGEAVAIAALFNDMKCFPERPDREFDYHFDIRALVSLAGVDGQYLPGGDPLTLKDVDYLVLQGSHDMDISTFMGYNQYDRLQYSGLSECFKAAVYIYGANHGQFNSGWGRQDLPGLGGRALNEARLIPQEEQEQIVKVLVSAFLDASLKGRAEYRGVFQNITSAEGWLPETIYVQDYWDSKSLALADFGEDVDPSTASLPAAAIAGRNLERWKEEIVETKYGSLLRNNYKAVRLAWSQGEKGTACYEVSLPYDLYLNEDCEVVFSVADKSSAPFRPGDELTDFSIVLEDRYGNVVRLPLSALGTLYPMLEGNFVKWPLDRMGMSREPVFQSFSLPLSRLRAENEAFDPGRLRKIRFDFDLSEEGEIYIREIGLRYVERARAAGGSAGRPATGDGRCGNESDVPCGGGGGRGKSDDRDYFR